MIIRRAAIEDLDALIALGAAMHAESPRYSRLPFSEERVRAIAEHVISQGIALVAVSAMGGIVGMLAGIVSQHWFSTALIASDLVFYVAPEHRGGRAFFRLVREFEYQAAERGASEVQIGLSTEVNTEAAAGCCERLGFRRGSVGMVKYV